MNVEHQEGLEKGWKIERLGGRFDNREVWRKAGEQKGQEEYWTIGKFGGRLDNR